MQVSKKLQNSTGTSHTSGKSTMLHDNPCGFHINHVLDMDGHPQQNTKETW